MKTPKLAGLLASLMVVAITSVASYAFTGPYYGPALGNSSSGSLLNLMAGSGFSSMTDSLSAIAYKIRGIHTAANGTDVGIGTGTPAYRLDVYG